MKSLHFNRAERSRLRQLAGCCLTVALLLPCCSDEPARDAADTIKGKTPVVRPEDVQGQGSGGASVLAPDYRQALVAGLDAAANRAASGGGAAVTDAKAPKISGSPQTAGATTAPPPPEPLPVAPAPAAAGSGAARSSGFPVAGCRQLVLVTAADANANRGTLRLFERQGPDAPWREAGAATACSLGRTGLGVGRGLGEPLAGPAKHGGDGRTPAGLFRLPEAFGYAGADVARKAGVRLPYAAVTDRTACVTEPGSELFGKVAGPEKRPDGLTLRQDRMVRSDGANVWGVVIGHNQDAPEPQAGTCLFVNVRPEGGAPTGGSIGLPEARAAALVAWLDPVAEPLLAVLPEKQYQQRQAAWGLP